jgi:hypothetical protein
MRARAIIIGIDGYAGQPLTSAVRDATAFRDYLVKLGLVRPEEVVLLTDAAANRDGIGAALKQVYDNGLDLDRLYVYFSGHGMMAPVDAAGSVLCTALVPSDVVDLAADGYKLVNLDDLAGRLRTAGPREQLFFIDACRDLAFGAAPGNVPRLSWPASGNPSSSANAQATLFAVSPRGQALGARDGMGVMTAHLLAALADDGAAVEWSEESDGYVITMESVRSCVRANVQAAVRNRPFWEQRYMLPDLVTLDPPLPPIRTVAHPPRRALTVTIEPARAAAVTWVALAQRRNELAAPRWPPRRSGETVSVEPQRYRIIAHSRAGDTVIDPPLIDVRVRSTALVQVISAVPPPAAAEPVERSGPGRATVSELGRLRQAGDRYLPTRGPSGPPPGPLSGPPPGARLRATTREASAAIEVAGLAPPYHSWTDHGRLDREVPPGFYRVRFRLGSEVFSETELEAVPGGDLVIEPTVAPSAVLSEMFGGSAARPAVVLSESIGPIQSAVLDTMLPIIGVKPFDRTGELFSHFTDLVPVLDPAAFADRPLSVVLAAEGERWPWPVEEVLAAASCECRRHGPGGDQDPAGDTVVTVALRPLRSAAGRRVALGVATAPAGSFTVTLSAPHFGRIELAAASIPGRVTVVTVLLSADGTLNLRQNLLRFPGRRYLEPVPDVPYGRMLHDLQVGQRLYESGELVSAGDLADTGTLRELLHAKWTDPVLGCMAYHAWTDAARLGQLDRREALALARRTAMNLSRHFPELPDAMVVQALDDPERAPSTYGRLLTFDQVPILARSARELARAAREAGQADRRVVRWADRLSPQTPWTAAWELPAASLPDLTPGADR